jgi:two-component system cell cycle response regulator
METRILVIEDNPASLELMGYLLEAFGYTAIRASSGEEGLDAATREVPDLIVCDIQLPGIDGHEIARRLASDPVLKDIPRVAVTALAMVGDRDKVLASGFNGYLAKPIAPESFVKHVEAFLRPEQLSSGRRSRENECAAPKGNDATPAPPTHAKGVILIVDDSSVNISVLSSLLEAFGYTVVSARNIKEGIRASHHYAPDLLISDLHVGGESGYEFLKLVKADPWLRWIPFIFLSSTAVWERDQAYGLLLGADRFLVRPIDPPVLLEAIEAVINKRRTI